MVESRRSQNYYRRRFRLGLVWLRLEVAPGSALQIGLDFVTASMWLRANDMPSDGKTHWFNGGPPPLVGPNDQNSTNGNHLFMGALAWILRHEIAHMTR